MKEHYIEHFGYRGTLGLGENRHIEHKNHKYLKTTEKTITIYKSVNRVKIYDSFEQLSIKYEFEVKIKKRERKQGINLLYFVLSSWSNQGGEIARRRCEGWGKERVCKERKQKHAMVVV